MTLKTYNKNVFINCPFDKKYKETFYAIIFTASDCGYIPRCALELEDGSENRLKKILGIIKDCRFAIHDISRTELDAKNKLPRFNMPLELGLFIAAKQYGNSQQKKKSCLILDSAPFRFQKFISDIAGHDIKAHKNILKHAITLVRDWLHNNTQKNTKIPGGKHIAMRYKRFQRKKPALCKRLNLVETDLTFRDYRNLIALWLKSDQKFAQIQL